MRIRINSTELKDIIGQVNKLKLDKKMDQQLVTINAIDYSNIYIIKQSGFKGLTLKIKVEGLVEEPGQINLSLKQLKLLKNFKTNKFVTIDSSFIKEGNKTINVNRDTISQIPLETLKTPTLVFTTDTKNVFNILHSVATDDTRPILNMCNISLQNKEWCSVDGYTLSIRRMETTFINSNINTDILVPSEVVELLDKYKKLYKEYSLYMNENNETCKFVAGPIEIYFQRCTDNFINYNQIVNNESKMECVVNCKDLLENLKFIKDISDKENYYTSMRFANFDSNTKLDIVFKNIESSTTINQSFKNLHEEYLENEFEIGFDINYMYRAIKSITSDEIKLAFNNRLDPIQVYENDFDIELVLPMRKCN